MSEHDRLSALLDGELSVADESQLVAQMEADTDLLAEFEAVSAARRLVRGLGSVDPPSDFVFRPADPVAEVIPMARHRRRPWVLGAAAATVFFVVLGFATGIPGTDIVPPIGDFVSQHAVAVEALPETATSAEFTKMPMDQIDELGPSVGTMPMVAAYQSDDAMQLVYGGDDGNISVFRQDGQLPDEAVAQAEVMETERGPAYHLTVDGAEVVVIEHDGVIFTMVADHDHLDTAMEMVDQVPDRDQSVIQTLRRWFGRWR